MIPSNESSTDRDDHTVATAETARVTNTSSSTEGGDEKDENAERHLNLVDKLGGPEKLIRLMDEFYSRVIVDPVLTKFFLNTDMNKLKRHSLNIIATAFAPTERSGDAMDIPAYLSKSHKRLFEQRGVTEVHFDRFVGLFVETMESLDVDPETVGEAEGKLRRFRCVFEEGAAAAASARRIKRRDSKVRFLDEERARSWGVSLSEREKYVAGACVVAGAIVASCLVLRKRRF
mmetsp:Transcript_3532/g.6155  ORF Transcript_3532/g.6155 Transcript_3532/m.6155 type:complete len:232 (-) Transcript_3532:345-1040(-)|eukprot:CAMPEP_0197442448 /NCGR_PEP_ID=MMETSP1175-20131217/8466_1 /TAXON_ID=1003142 /ORGANISM="Triceratium dubium, Strain CCMP147" /LENGTH=231 /DNA_ID=CAMNT_0042972925 /DNA_START=120 /DNA_END=815 /DNA_ORIENTATION=-